jgi:hypothetical protein
MRLYGINVEDVKAVIAASAVREVDVAATHD